MKPCPATPSNRRSATEARLGTAAALGADVAAWAKEGEFLSIPATVEDVAGHLERTTIRNTLEATR